MFLSCGSIVELGPLIAAPSWAKARKISGRRAMISCELGTNPIRASDARSISSRPVVASCASGASRGIIYLPRLLCPHNCRQLRERGDLAIRFSRQPLRPLAIAVAPHHAHAEGRGSMSVPGIGRLERDRVGRDRQPVDGELIDLGVRFVDPYQLHRKDGIEEIAD